MNRRSLLIGLGTALAAPAIVRAESIMRVASLRAAIAPGLLTEYIGFDFGRDSYTVVYTRLEGGRLKIIDIKHHVTAAELRLA